MIDIAKLRPGARVLVEAIVQDVGFDTVLLRCPHSCWQMPSIIRQIASQPFRAGDLVRWYLNPPHYNTGRFVGAVKDTDKVVVNGGGLDIVVPADCVRHENLGDPECTTST